MMTMDARTGVINKKPITVLKADLDAVYRRISALLHQLSSFGPGIDANHSRLSQIIVKLTEQFTYSQQMVHLVAVTLSSQEFSALKRRFIQNFSHINDTIRLIERTADTTFLDSSTQKTVADLLHFQQVEENQVYNYLATVEASRLS